MRRHVCDACGKVAEAPVDDIRMPEERNLPNGWLTVTVTERGLTRSADCHSKPCAAKWVAKRERRRKLADKHAPPGA